MRSEATTNMICLPPYRAGINAGNYNEFVHVPIISDSGTVGSAHAWERIRDVHAVILLNGKAYRGKMINAEYVCAGGWFEPVFLQSLWLSQSPTFRT